MNKLKKVLREITDLTFEIETNYPELYQYLDENPFTLPVSRHPHIDKAVLQEYLQGLRELLKHHLETHKAENNIDKPKRTMGEIATSDRMITLFYNSKSRRAKQTLAYARAEGLPMEEIDLLKTPLTGTQIAELAGRLKLKVGDLVNQNHPAYKHLFEPHNLSTEDWIKLIQKNPEVMKQPIALRGDLTILVETPTDIIKI
ncbi:MAG: hypothetical protein P8Z38_03130 [Robiginitalea sp.]